jgi:UDP-glucose 4-epimerase
MGNPTVLITGAAGFIGSRLTGILLKRGYTCIGVDNLSVGCSSLAPRKNLVFRIQDICEAESMNSLFLEFKPNVVVHLAAIHHIPTCEQNPSKALYVNIVGTQHVLDAAEIAGCRRLVFASTGGVYDWIDGPLDEETPVRPTDIYI